MSDVLYGLEVSEFRHPADIAALNIVNKTIIANKLGDLLQKKEAYLQYEIEFTGTGIRLTKENASEVYEIFSRAKETMDFDAEVDLYCNRAFSSQFVACGTNRYYIGVPDAAIRLFTKAQLQFFFGQCITSLKGKMAEMFSLARFIESTSGMIPVVGDLLSVPLGQWKRKAQLTLDRGGLLACQDYEAVEKFMMWIAGVPQKDLDNIDVDAHLKEMVESMKDDKGFAETIGNIKNTLLNTRNLYSRERFIELYNWYTSGSYSQIIQAHT